VFETEPVKNAVRNGIISGLIVDCWENEPEIDLELLDLADYGTSHIAGYSRDGKANGTAMSVRAVSKFFNLGIGDWKPGNVEMPEKTVIEIKRDTGDEYNILADAVLSSYSIENDDKALRISPGMFEKLREEYPVRREFGVYTVIMGNMARQTKEKLKKMGFNIKESGTLPA
jgi:erythronate-4-phosphate dehydrogenase